VKLTSLNLVMIAVVFAATAMQCVRGYLYILYTFMLGEFRNVIILLFKTLMLGVLTKLDLV